MNNLYTKASNQQVISLRTLLTEVFNVSDETRILFTDYMDSFIDDLQEVNSFFKNILSLPDVGQFIRDYIDSTSGLDEEVRTELDKVADKIIYHYSHDNKCGSEPIVWVTF